ncbi:fumarase class II [Paraburkholderia caballeronis]|uniref:class II fumarate hydratase n=1 Tax=Paraburkholderia caballeronis TaxID=416943 RepID=UPI001066A3A1|nr:class II fumarate hydratase [Paraburkholderia caballeronis]TDV34274.1 fumarase class II [Paraburkholderia caballeronis]
MTTTHPTRIERDAFGAVEIPADRYWGAQTQRALGLFEIGDERFPAVLVHAFGLHKWAAARVNAKLGVLDARLAGAIETAATEVRDGEFDGHFPLTVWQTGSGTQTNMNANEVIANRANELLGQPLGTKSPVHPNDHVNASQSSNDSFPTVMHMAAALELTGRLRPALDELRVTLQARARAFAGIVKVARTHLMDAVPMTMEQTFDAFAHQAANAVARIDSVLPRVLVVPQGGSAAGTGLNVPPGFAEAFCDELAGASGLAFAPNPSKFEGMGAHDALVEASGVLNAIAVALLKIANDVRWLGSGPRCGLGELRLPDDGLTSSIMPGKRNPTIAEVLAQACFQVAGNHQTVTMAGASGNFELNVAKPVLIYNLLQSIRVLADAVVVFSRRLVAGLDVDRERVAANVENALLVVTALNPVLGYDNVARIIAKAVDERIGPRAAALALGLLDADAYDRIVDPARLAAGGRADG